MADEDRGRDGAGLLAAIGLSVVPGAVPNGVLLAMAADLSVVPGAVPKGVLLVISGVGEDVFNLASDLLSKEVTPF